MHGPERRSKVIGVSREDLEGTALREAVIRLAGPDAISSEAEVDESRHEALRGVSLAEDLWVFGYGSLIWNPIFEVTERRRATVFGFHRAFCMESTLGRGSKERPGLMLALDPGGACAGVALRMSGDKEHELRLLWRREMLTRSYRPAWVRARTAQGTIRALTFVADRKAPHYLGRIPLSVAAARITGASGLLGDNLGYLAQTSAGLAAHGIDDPYLQQLLGCCGKVLEAQNGPSDDGATEPADTSGPAREF